MANPPYTGGVASVEPSAAPPSDYQNIQASPSAFGGQIAQGLEKFGQGATSASKAFGEIQSDDASTQAMQRMDAALSKFRNLRGQDRLNAQKDTEAEIEAAYNEGRQGLGSPLQQHQYDQAVRNFRLRYISGQMSTLSAEAAHTYATSTNTNAASFHLNLISQNPTDDQTFLDNVSEVKRAAVRQAQIQGLGDQGAQQAAATAQAEAYATRAKALAVKDPLAARTFIDANQKQLAVVDSRTGSTYYDALSNEVRQRANRQKGDGVAKEELGNTHSAVPATGQVAPILEGIGSKYGISGSYLTRAWQLEASGRLDPPDSSTGAAGPFQFTRGTAKQVGVANPHDFMQSAEGAAKLAATNKVVLQDSLGRDPTDAELYLAHQQGSHGAALLLNNPNIRAGDLLPAYRTRDGKIVDPIKDNGGDPNAPASAFTSMWTAKYNGSGIALASARKAQAYRNIMARNDLSEEERDYAVQRVNRDIAMQTQADDLTEHARKLNNEAAANEYGTKIGTGQFVDLNAMWNDPRITDIKTKEYLQELAEKKGFEDPSQYGPGYSDALKRIVASPDDPGRITDINQILQMEVAHQITSRGRDQLTKVLSDTRNQKLGEHDPTAVARTKSHLLDYVKNEMSRDQIIAGSHVSTNLKGLQAFNAKFVPAFEDSFDKWTKANPNKSPYEFLNKDNIDKMMDQVYPKSQRDADSISGLVNAGGAPAEKGAPLPPAPEKLDADAWKSIVSKPPMLPTGQRATPAQWAQAVQLLTTNPTPKVKEAFDKWFGPAGYNSNDVLKSFKIGESSHAPEAKPAASESGFRPGSVLDRLTTARQHEAGPLVDPSVRRREIEREQALEGAGVVKEAP